jgi:hypothetical protein
MRILPLFLIVILAWSNVCSAKDTSVTPLDTRLITLASAATPTAEDHEFLMTRSKGFDSEGCVAIALLFKHWPDQHREDFKKFYGVDPSIKLVILSDQEINTRVNARLQELKGRHPLEVTSQLYLLVRRSGYASKRANGDELSLEAMFRGAVFTGITGTGKIEDVHRLSAIADGKTPPNQITIK